jgi:hypothetical protein
MRDWRRALYRLSEIKNIHWAIVSGGVGARAPDYFLYGYVNCQAALEGEIAHSGTHGPCPHSIKVVILKKDNEPEVMRLLMEEAGPKPECPPSCAEDALKYVQQQGEVLGPDLRAYLQSLGHHPMQINKVLLRLERRGKLISRRVGRAKSYRLPQAQL